MTDGGLGPRDWSQGNQAAVVCPLCGNDRQALRDMFFDGPYLVSNLLECLHCGYIALYPAGDR